MSDISFELQETLTRQAQTGDTAECVRVITKRLAKMRKSPFHKAIKLEFNNSPAEIAGQFDAFLKQEAPRCTIGALYAEMNGFDINTDLWFFNIFGFEKYGGHEDYDWLGNWNSGTQDIPLTGMEELQEIFEGDDFLEPEHEDAVAVAGLLVVAKFQDLLRRAVPHMKELKCPVLATAHEYDFISEVRRKA